MLLQVVIISGVVVAVYGVDRVVGGTAVYVAGEVVGDDLEALGFGKHVGERRKRSLSRAVCGLHS